MIIKLKTAINIKPLIAFNFKNTNLINIANKSKLNFINLNGLLYNSNAYQTQTSPPRSKINFMLNFNKNIFTISHLQQEDDIKQLQIRYKFQKNYDVFDPIVKSSESILDQLNIFKIFKILEENQFNYDVYQKFFNDIDKVIKKKSDTMLLLLARLKVTMAKNYIKNKEYGHAIKNLQESLDILQRSLVPPLFPYYTIYRHYGFVHYEIGEIQKSKQILTESVQILQEYLNHSDDQVASNQNCRQQARAYNILIKIDNANKAKWLERANKEWTFFDGQKHKEIQYARTVGQNLKKQLQNDKEKGQSYYHFNLYKFQDNNMKQIIKTAKKQAENQKSQKSN